MKFIRGINNIAATQPEVVATIGNFDGVHKGHQEVLAHLVEEARQLNLPSLLIIFEPLPLEYFQGEQAPARLFRLGEKLRILQGYAIDYVLCIKFNEKFAKLNAEKFIEDILVKKLKIKSLIVGDDFRFGHQRQGDYDLLEKYGKKLGFTVKKTSTFNYASERVGSSRVRQALAMSDFAHAKELLGFPYFISGRVTHGNKDGRKFGFPTANIALRRRVIPLHGVFCVKVYGLAHKPLFGVANVGRKPTMNGTDRLLEVYLLDFNQDIYGQYIEVEFVNKLRDEQKFASIEELKQKIAEDVAKAKEFFSKSM